MSSTSAGQIVTLNDDQGNTCRWFTRDGYYFGAFRKTSEECNRLYDDIQNFRTRPGDVWICAFQKSGTHWLWEVAMMLLTDADELLAQPKEWTMLENCDADTLEKVESPRVLNSHHFINVLPKDIWKRGTKIIHPVRNIKDVLVSYYHHKAKMGHLTGTFEGFVNLLDKPYTQSWYVYENEWWTRHQDDPDVLFLMYEEMVKDPKQMIQTVADFLEVPLTEDRLRTIAEKTSLHNMKANKTQSGPKSDINNLFYRKGQPGDWKNHFTVAMDERFEKLHRERTRGLAFRFVNV